MKNEEINKAIAESLGWTNVRTMISSKQINPFAFGINTNGQSEIVPNYAESLDACAEFENTLIHPHDMEYSKILSDFYEGIFQIAVFATPLQRCEAYLRMKGLWKEQ